MQVFCSRLLVLLATICQEGARFLSRALKKRLVEVDVRSFFFNRSSALGVGWSPKSVKTRFLQAKGTLLAVLTLFQLVPDSPDGCLLGPPPPKKKTRWPWWFFLEGFPALTRKKQPAFYSFCCSPCKPLRVHVPAWSSFIPLRCLAACETAWQAVPTWPNFDRRQCQKRFEENCLFSHTTPQVNFVGTTAHALQFLVLPSRKRWINKKQTRVRCPWRKSNRK